MHHDTTVFACHTIMRCELSFLYDITLNGRVLCDSLTYRLFQTYIEAYEQCCQCRSLIYEDPTSSIL